MTLSRRAFLQGVAGLAGLAVLDPVEPVKRIWALGGIPEPTPYYLPYRIRENPEWIKALQPDPTREDVLYLPSVGGGPENWYRTVEAVPDTPFNRQLRARMRELSREHEVGLKADLMQAKREHYDRLHRTRDEVVFLNPDIDAIVERMKRIRVEDQRLGRTVFPVVEEYTGALPYPLSDDMRRAIHAEKFSRERRIIFGGRA